MAAKLRNSCEKCKDRVNNCKKKHKDLFDREKMSKFATTNELLTHIWNNLL